MINIFTDKLIKFNSPNLFIYLFFFRNFQTFPIYWSIVALWLVTVLVPGRWLVLTGENEGDEKNQKSVIVDWNGEDWKEGVCTQ